MIYSVWVNIVPDFTLDYDWDYFSIENVVSKRKLSYDEVIEIALAEAIKDVKEIYGLSEDHIKYTKASVITANYDTVFEN